MKIVRIDQFIWESLDECDYYVIPENMEDDEIKNIIKDAKTKCLNAKYELAKIKLSAALPDTNIDALIRQDNFYMHLKKSGILNIHDYFYTQDGIKNVKDYEVDWDCKEGPYIANNKTYWYKNNKLHREDGPAIESEDGTNEWYIEGKKYTLEEFNKHILTIKLSGIK